MGAVGAPGLCGCEARRGIRTRTLQHSHVALVAGLAHNASAPNRHCLLAACTGEAFTWHGSSRKLCPCCGPYEQPAPSQRHKVTRRVSTPRTRAVRVEVLAKVLPRTVRCGAADAAAAANHPSRSWHRRPSPKDRRRGATSVTMASRVLRTVLRRVPSFASVAGQWSAKASSRVPRGAYACAVTVAVGFGGGVAWCTGSRPSRDDDDPGRSWVTPNDLALMLQFNNWSMRCHPAPSSVEEMIKEERAAKQRRARAAVGDTVPRLVIFGAPGAGKGTQCAKVSETFGAFTLYNVALWLVWGVMRRWRCACVVRASRHHPHQHGRHVPGGGCVWISDWTVRHTHRSPSGRPFHML